MRMLYRTIYKTLRDGRSAVLVSVLSAEGSTPRSAGAMMAVFSDGSSVGTIGGGNVELQAQRTAAKLMEEKRDLVQRFRFAPGDAASLGMVCGGDQTILFQYLDAGDAGLSELFRDLTEADGGGRDTWLVRRVENERVADTGIADRNGIRFSRETPPALPGLLGSQPVYREDGWFSVPVVRAGHTYIFGGGHVAQALVPVIAPAGFRPVIYDDREEFADPKLFPQAEGTICGEFSDIRKKIHITSDDYVVIMTRGHRGDSEALRQTLRSGARYIGCIGSKKKLAFCREQLLQEGFTAEEYDAVHAPIGLAIGAETPEEIAISVGAEMVAVRAGLN